MSSYDSPFSWDNLSFNQMPSRRMPTLRTESYVRSSRAYAEAGGSYGSLARGFGSRYAASSGSAAMRSSSIRRPSADFEWEDDFASDRPRRSRTVREEERPTGKLTLTQKLGKMRHDRRKAKAGRQFARQFADVPSDAPANAPRAAVYTGSVGSKQRQAMDMQRGSSGRGRSSRLASASKPSFLARFLEKMHSPRNLAVGIVAVSLVAICAFMYPTARDYYQTVRHTAQLEAEYAAIQERNAALQQEVDSLQTEQGVSDRAHELYGWVGPGDNSVLVQGIERTSIPNSKGYQAAVAPDSIPAPDTWYSPVLDWFFGYDNNPVN